MRLAFRNTPPYIPSAISPPFKPEGVVTTLRTYEFISTRPLLRIADIPFFNTVTSEPAFKSRFKIEEAKLFLQLPELSAYDWDCDHLFACRVIRRPARPSILTILAEYSDRSGLHSSDEIVRYIEGPNPAYMTRSEHHLVRDVQYGISLGQTWAAMAAFRRPQGNRTTSLGTDAEDEAESVNVGRAKRLRRHTLQDEGFVDSSTLQIGSSSSQGTSSVGLIDNETHLLLSLPEDETPRLVSSVIRHILYFGPPQNFALSPAVLEFRDAKARLSALTPGLRRRLTATDDGGLCFREELGGIFEVNKNRVAILEA